MHTRIVVLVLVTAAAAALAAGCKSVDCGDGTTEKDGACVAANQTVGTAACGPFTVLAGTQCVPMFPPTTCDPATTQEDKDEMGVTTCIGTGGGGCSAKLACPAPTDGKQTICGQLFDFATNTPFAAPNATGAACTAAAASGPCAVGLKAYDALAFAQNPGTTPLGTGTVYIDDCGRYRVPEITQPASPFVALGLDDAMIGGGGITNPTGVATTAWPNTATKDLDAFIVPKATTDAWTASGGPAITSGFYVPVYHGHRTGADLAAGVTVAYGPMGATQPALMDANRDFYFAPADPMRTTLMAGTTVTGVNGTALFAGATLNNEQYSGVGGLPATCVWDVHAGASTPGVVFIQAFRPTNAPGQTCAL